MEKENLHFKDLSGDSDYTDLDNDVTTYGGFD